MAKQAESGDVGHRVDGIGRAEIDSRRVEFRRAVDQVAIGGWRQRILSQRGSVDAHAQRLAQDERIARPRAAVALDAVRMSAADDGETVDWLDRVDRMSAGHWNAGFFADRFAAGCDSANHV